MSTAEADRVILEPDDPITRRPMSLAEFLQLPDDPALDRELVNGVLWEQEMTVRNRKHGLGTARISQRLANFLDSAAIDADVGDGEIGVLLPSRESAVGVDVAVFRRADLDAAEQADARFIEGIPLLVVEVLSPSDQVQDVDAKTDEYLAAGVPLVWIVNASRRTVTAHAADGLRFFSGDDVVDAAPAFEGFSLPVQKLFER